MPEDGTYGGSCDTDLLGRETQEQVGLVTRLRAALVGLNPSVRCDCSDYR